MTRTRHAVDGGARRRDDSDDGSLTRTDPAVERLRRDAEPPSVSIELVARGEARTLAEAAANIGIEPRQIVTTLVAEARRTQTTKGHSCLVALVPGDRQVDGAKLRRLAGMTKVYDLAR